MKFSRSRKERNDNIAVYGVEKHAGHALLVRVDRRWDHSAEEEEEDEEEVVKRH